MNAWFGDRWCCNARPDRAWRSGPRTTAPLALAPFSTWLPRELVGRSRMAAPQLGLRQSENAVAAINRFLTEYGF